MPRTDRIPRRRRVYSIDPETLSETLVAEAELQPDESVVVTFHSAGGRILLEDGIIAFDRRLRPADGRAFFDGLPKHFARSSFITVRDE